jgi:starch phosphorylase
MDKNEILQKIRSTCKGKDAVALYQELAGVIQDTFTEERTAAEKYEGKRAIYLSCEFLVGRTILNNLLNLGILDEVRTLLAENGIDINMLEEIEDCALGNGGLGRLAACYLDSAATLGIPLYGNGIRYRYGLFKQEFVDGFQKELPDDWQRFGDPFSVRREDKARKIVFGGGEALAVPYDMTIFGYGGKVCLLRLWQAEGNHEAQKISEYLYPDDSTDEGRILRLRQEYFFSAAAIGEAVDCYTARYGNNFKRFPDCYVFQLNDTHPVAAILEFIRLLTEEYDQSFSAACAIARKCFAYTNHTVMPEALERWYVPLFYKALPALGAIADKLDRVLQREYRKKGLTTEEIDKVRIRQGNMFHMANLAVYMCFSVNGVAKIHTDIIKNKLFDVTNRLCPQKFVNITNGITQRRWLGLANPDLAAWITEKIGDGWRTDLDRLSALREYASPEAYRRLNEIKAANKKKLAAFILAKEGVAVDPESIFDVQIKRLHEYKRQLMNALSILTIYYRLKDKSLMDFTPTTFLFGAKAAGSYFRAKAIIKFIHEIAARINADPEVNHLIRVVFVTDYNVSYAEKLVAAADISEQISLAGTEASGTGNMKLALNGAVTLGTMDGATIEIIERAGQENNYIFGLKASDVDKARGIPPVAHLADPYIARAIASLWDGSFSDGGTGYFKNIYDALISEGDRYLVLSDLEDYIRAKLLSNREYKDRESFARKAFMNIASAGYFSSDRSVKEYDERIWHTKSYIGQN